MSQATARTIDTAHESHYVFERGFPTPATMAQAYDDADLNRAIQAYKFFYPTVSGAAILRGNEQIGVVPNKVFGILDCGPEQLVFTANSDTPYGPLLLDLAVGPLVVEPAPGPLIVCSMDVNQRWVADMGLPGPDAGKGGKHLLLPPAYTGDVPTSGYYGELASLGIEKGKPFEPDARLTRILDEAAGVGNAQMRVQSFGDRRPDRTVWNDRRWQWASLRFEDGDFNLQLRLDTEAREKWF